MKLIISQENQRTTIKEEADEPMTFVEVLGLLEVARLMVIRQFQEANADARSNNTPSE